MAGTDVLEFGLDDERYCVDISYVSEIIALEELTSVPNTPDYVLGVMDLRGRSLQVRDPKGPFGVSGEPTGGRVVVMASEVGPEDKLTGWLVDSVHDVLTARRADVDDDVEGTGVHGALRPGADEDGAAEGEDGDVGSGRLVIWVDPHEVFD
jgi:purine-binding chemotaxis protein CheW